MKLKFYTKSEFIKTVTGISSITISKAGAIRFSKELLSGMNLTATDLIQLAQDENEKKNWYIVKVKDDGFKVDMKRNAFTCKALANAVKKSLGYRPDECIFIRVSSAPVEYYGKSTYAIITNSVTVKK